MARLASQERMLYYPTPPVTTEHILSLFLPAANDDPPHRLHGTLRMLDPCAGEGKALQDLAIALNTIGQATETYGVELSPDRAAKAADRLDHIIQGSWDDIGAA